MEFDELGAERLLLRMFREDDLQFVFNHFSDPDVSRYLYDHEPPTSLDEAREILKWCIDFGSPDHIRWCIEIPGQDTPIGTCGFHRYDPQNNSAEIGYDLSQKWWGQGIMKEALTHMLKFVFDIMKLNRVYAYVYPKNKRSASLMNALGFTHEGVIREKHLFRGKYYDHALYSLLKREVE